MSRGQIQVEYDDNGEITRRYAVFELPDKSRIQGGWFMAMQDGFEWLAKQDFTGETWRVLACVMAKLDFENYILIKQADVAIALRMPKQNVSRAMSVLLEKGVIHSGPKVGQVKTYRLDPSFGFKGRAKNMGKLLELVHGKDGRKNSVKAPPVSEEKRLEVEGQLKMFDAPEGK